jgi:Restriction endonuclease BglII
MDSPQKDNHLDAQLLWHPHLLARLALTLILHRTSRFYVIFTVVHTALVHLQDVDQPLNTRRGFTTLGTELLPEGVRRHYDVAERHHACAILHTDFPTEWNDLMQGLDGLRLPKTQLLTPGGGKSPISKAINGFFYEREWEEKQFDVKVTVDDAVTLSPTHHVDYYKNRIAIETEWNNKDPFLILVSIPFAFLN